MSRGAAPAEDCEPVIVISSSPSSADSGRAATASTGVVRGVPRSRLRSAKKLARRDEPDKIVKEEEKEEKEEEEKGDTEKENEESENGIRVRVKGPSDVVFPMRRVKILMTECENCRPSRESVFLVNKAAELFLESFVADAYKKARIKSLTYKDLSSTVCAKRKYQFLSGIFFYTPIIFGVLLTIMDYVPEKIRAEDALKARASLES